MVEKIVPQAGLELGTAPNCSSGFDTLLALDIKACSVCSL